MLSETLLKSSFCQSNIVFPCFIIFDERQLLSRGQWSFIRQLHVFDDEMVDDGYRIFLLCLLMIACIFSIQL